MSSPGLPPQQAPPLPWPHPASFHRPQERGVARSPEDVGVCECVCPQVCEMGGGGQSPCSAPSSAKPPPCFMLWGWRAHLLAAGVGVYRPPFLWHGMGMGSPPPSYVAWGWEAPLPCVLWGGESSSLLCAVGVGGPPSLLCVVGVGKPSLPAMWLCAVGVGSPPSTSHFGNQAKNYA